ncbi:molybdopterin-guanine dinucleotide biosynthesis protein B [Hydrogenivirga sp.]
MKVIAIVGYHNSGKTTLVERLVDELKGRGFKVGYVKHDPKGHGTTDREGSDTDRVFMHADRVALSSPDRLTLWDRRSDEDPFGVVRNFFKGFDVVILEGFKGFREIPKVAVGEVEAENVVLRVEGARELGHIIELLENMEDNL